MSSIHRRNEILIAVRRIGSVAVDELVQTYGVSVETIRRDLRVLDEKGFLRRTYGGAVKKEQTTWDVPYYERIQLNLDRKEAIAREAVQLLEEGDSVFIDGNTSGLALSRYVPDDKNLTIVTNSAMVTLNLIQKKGKLKVYMVGGEVDEDGKTFGYKLHCELRQYRFDKALFSCMGFGLEGIYYSKWEPLQIAQMLVKQSNHLILMADSSKVNRSGFLYGMELSRIHTLVTDEGTPLDMRDSLRESVRHLIIGKSESKEIIK
ncbi:DeoR/GlpR family DNA-binding transcription regulator [Paenibacillus agricola]|uniref:DeoR/GlpR transcriptional regulator n=1 Tax=Paenibacillus agricola TaxID=2716264 RepID=A0ABX0J2B6_9BACL|nr:DeoR/GlpR family DNA-binding transcription regulator [Paenibacillus agricola]NHN29022.1 DeoR/GlpR transcriptional regulator [Paenibacillus agricola]